MCYTSIALSLRKPALGRLGGTINQKYKPVIDYGFDKKPEWQKYEWEKIADQKEIARKYYNKDQHINFLFSKWFF